MHRKFLLFLVLLICYSNASQGQNADIRLLREINLNRNKSLDGTFIVLTNSAAPISVGMPIGLLGVGLLSKDSALTRNALVIGTSVVVSTVITTVMKKSINRPRPFETYPDIEKLSLAGSSSFPSGHTSGAFALATSLSLEYPKWYVIAPSFAWASAVAYSRMDLGVHYPSDILMGAVVGAGSAWLCHYVNKKVFRQKNILNWLY